MNNFVSFATKSLDEMKKQLKWFQYEYPNANEGDNCVDWYCDGKFEVHEKDVYCNCSCHISAPCWSCEQDKTCLICSECEYEAEYGCMELTEAQKRKQLENYFLAERRYELNNKQREIKELYNKIYLAEQKKNPTEIVVQGYQSWHSGTKGHGTHPNCTREEIIKSVGIRDDITTMLEFSMTETTFSYSYFTD